jgi:uncharacterized HAD superfamily protein
MKIGIDIDEVLAKFIVAFAEYHNKQYETSLKESDFSSYNLEGVLGVTTEEKVKRLKEFYLTEEFKNLEPVPGSKERVLELKKNNELFIITSRHKEAYKVTKVWIEKHFPNTFSGMYFADYSAEDAITKNHFCEELGIDVFIDDCLTYATECGDKDTKVFLYDFFWNQTEELPDKVTRVKSWDEIVKSLS